MSTVERVAAARASAGISAEPIYRAVLRTLDERSLGGDVADLGAGTGALAHALCDRASVTSVTAVDLVDFDGRPEHPKLRWAFGDLNEPLPLPDESFDLVLAVELVEHLENPRAAARDWFRLLRPGGALVLTTPNNESWRALASLVVRGHFIAFTDACYPAHLTALTRTDLMRVLTEAGFAPPRFFFTDHGDVPRLTRLTWQRLSRGRLRGLRYSDNVGCVAVRPSA